MQRVTTTIEPGRDRRVDRPTNIVQRRTSNQQTAPALAIGRNVAALALCVMAVGGCRTETDRGANQPPSTSPPPVVKPAPGGATPTPTAAPIAAPEQPVVLAVRTARPLEPEQWPEPERAPHGLTLLPGDTGAGAHVALVDGQSVRSWSIAANGDTRELTSVPLGEDQLVATHVCGGVSLAGDPAVVLVRRDAGQLQSAALVRLPMGSSAAGRVVGLELPPDWQLAEAGPRPCRAWIDAAGQLELVVALGSGALGVARYAATDPGVERVGSALLADGRSMVVDAVPALGLATRQGRALVGYRGRGGGTGDRVYLVAEIDGETIGEPVEVARHARVAVLAAPAWRGDEPGAWTLDWSDAAVTDTAVAQPDVPLVWRSLDETSDGAVVSTVALTAWGDRVGWIEGVTPTDGYLLLQPRVPAMMPARLGALVAPDAPDAVLALAEAPTDEVTVAPWSSTRLVMAALRWRRGDEEHSGEASIELQWVSVD